MEDGSSGNKFPGLKSNWTLNEPLADPLLGMANDESFDSHFDPFMRSLGDHAETLLTEETVKQITEILTPEQQKILEDKTACLKQSGYPNQQQNQPCFVNNEHAQIDHAAGIRPCHGVAGIDKSAECLARSPQQIISAMQNEDNKSNPELLKTPNLLQVGLQRIKDQLDKSGKLVAPSDQGPAVVTEFIGEQGESFGTELDETSKCSVDSQENSIGRGKEEEPFVRRSSRKTVRLFEIVKKGVKKVTEEVPNAEEPRKLRSADDPSKNTKGTPTKNESSRKGKNTPKGDEAAEGKGGSVTRRSQKKPKTDDEKDSDDGASKRGKSDENESRRVGRPRKSAEKGKTEKAEAKGKGKSKSEDEAEKRSGSKNVEKKKIGRRSAGISKSESDEDSKSKGKKGKAKEHIPKTKREKTSGKKKATKENEIEKKEKSAEEESSSSNESVPDDGELSDDGSEFDPDDDPERPWCICRKPHGNRFMICCDTCEDWFHGDCVGVTQADGKELEKRGEEWMCPKCKRKLQALAKEVKEKERQERIKNRGKGEGSSDENTTSHHMRQKLLKALEKELESEKAGKHLKILKEEEQSSGSEEFEDDVIEEEEPETKVKEAKEIKVKEEPDEDDVKVKERKRIKMTKEERDAKEAKRIEKELEWKRQLKEMKERTKKAEAAAKRRDSVEGQITFEKIGNQKIIKQAEAKLIKQESVEKKHSDVKKEIVKERSSVNVLDRRKSDSNVKEGDRKRPLDKVRRVSEDIHREKIPKTESGQTKKVRITPTPKASKQSAPQKMCVVCNKPAMKNAVYCSKDCIISYTKESLRLLSEDKQRRLGPKSPEVKSPTSKDVPKGTTISPATSTTDDDDKNERIPVIERSTKKVIAGLMAPTRSKIFKWVEEHPTFEVFRPANSANSNQKEKKDVTEVVRKNVKKSLKETIIARCREVDMEVNVEEVAKICNAIEEEIVKMYGDAGQKYKTKYRSLIFNLKDSKNRSLYKQVVLGELSPAKLVHMSPEQLASAELAKWREREAKHNIEMIKKREEEDAVALKHAVKKTHKGEIELENEGEEDMQNLQTHIDAEGEPKEASTEDDGNTTSLEDTTDQHSSHLFDLNCKICTGKLQPLGEKQPILPHVSTSVVQAIPESSMPSPTDSPDENDLRQSSPDLIESMNRSPIHIPLPSKEKSDPIWKGFVMMLGVAKFASNAYRVSGPCDNLLKLLPDTIQICGRITHEQVWDYLFQLKSTTHKTIEVLRFEMAGEDDKKDYVSLYSYFYTRKRIGVIGNCHSGVKDMYIVPIASHDPVPPELLPFDGPGMPDPRPHMLIGVIVRKKPITPMKRPKSGHQETSEHSAKKSKKKHKHRKDDKHKYEDIIFGKQRSTVSLEETPSESGSSYTPSYTPDIMSPPSTTPASSSAAVASTKAEEERLEKQKAELMKLQAKVRAQISENRALGIPTSSPTVLDPSILAAPSTTTSEVETSHVGSSTTQAGSSSLPSIITSLTTSLTSISSSMAGSASLSISSSTALSSSLTSQTTNITAATASVTQPHDSSRHFSASQYPIATAVSGQGIAVATSGIHAHVSAHQTETRPTAQPTSQPTSQPTAQPTSQPTAQPTTHQPIHVTEKEEKEKASDADDPYDPEDELDTALELGNKEVEKTKTVPAGDEPYDPEDDFVLDLIEDISLPTSLKKIDKPNLPFPLEIPKKPENKMPELPPIKLPDKITDRRAASFSSSSLLIDPRTGASPRNPAVPSHVTTSTPNIASPSARSQSSLTSPSSASSQVTSPAQRSWDPRQTASTAQEAADNNYQYRTGVSESTSADPRHSAAQWQSDRTSDQSYGTYDRYQSSGEQQNRHGYYQGRYGDESYQRQWQGEQRGYDSSWQGQNYSNERGQSGDYRNWESGDQDYNNWRGDHYPRGQHEHDNNYRNNRDHYSEKQQEYSGDYRSDSSYRRPSQDYSNYSNYYGNEREYDRSWEGQRDRGYYRTHSRDRGRGNQWR